MKYSKKIYLIVVFTTLACIALSIHFAPPVKTVITKFEETSTLVLSDYSQIVVDKDSFEFFQVGNRYYDYGLIFFVVLLVLSYIQIIYLLYFIPL